MHVETFKRPPLSILFLIVSFASVGAVLFTPALPTIQSYFNLTVGQTQLTITIYLLGYALGQLPYGPLANHLGRKKTLSIGIVIAIIGSLLCALSGPLHSYSLLIFARFLQALGACVGIKISFTMIADVYPQTEATKAISQIGTAFAIMPGIAVALGGWITHLLNWESCFYFLALFGILVLFLTVYLPETSKSLDPHALRVLSIFNGYKAEFNNSRLIICGIMMGSASASIYVFASKSPFIGISLIGLSPEIFGNYNLIPAIGLFLGLLLAARLSGQFPVSKLLLIGILGAFASTLTMLIPFSLSILNPWSLFVPVLFIYLFQAIFFANTSSLGLAHAKNKSNGSAAINFINLSSVVIGVLFAEFVYPESAILLPISLILFFSIALALWFRLKKIHGEPSF